MFGAEHTGGHAQTITDLSDCTDREASLTADPQCRLGFPFWPTSSLTPTLRHLGGTAIRTATLVDTRQGTITETVVSFAADNSPGSKTLMNEAQSCAATRAPTDHTVWISDTVSATAVAPAGKLVIGLRFDNTQLTHLQQQKLLDEAIELAVAAFE
ncbi:MAG: hypothetical protein JWN95_2866 [Frankiales bacterium]|nr:hypothetical protein [Frankiales bacterium]